MTKELELQDWITEDGFFSQVPERGFCLYTETLEELAATVEGHGEVSSGLALVLGEALPEENLV